MKVINTIMALAVGCVALPSALLVSDCAATPAPNDVTKAAAECISHRTAKQLECVDLFSTKDSIDACRAKVEADIDCTNPDGGSDAH
jgi:hypothetical protein